MSNFGKALEAVKPDPLLRSYLKALYWGRHSKKRESRYSFQRKAEEIRPLLTPSQRNTLNKAYEYWRP